MRVVLDTSALVRLASSRPGLLCLKKMTAASIQLQVSAYLLAELERVLYRKFRHTRQQAKTTTKNIARVSSVVEVAHTTSLSRDASDEPIIALALAAKANVLVSDDDDILVLGTIGELEIIDYDGFMRLVGGRY